jgi:hypothetical protein
LDHVPRSTLPAVAEAMRAVVASLG